MTHINFLENKISFWRRIELNYFWSLIVIIIISLILGIWWYFSANSLSKIQKYNDGIKAEIAALQKIQDVRSSVKKVVKLPEKMLKNPVYWHVMLKDIAERLPKDVQLTEINGVLGKSRSVIIKGRATYLETLLRAEDKLRTIPRCLSISLETIEATQQENSIKEFTFQVKCVVS